MPDRAHQTEAERLRTLEERVERATRAAERLLAQARGPAGADPGADGSAAEDPGAGDGEGGVPPRGWQRPTDAGADAGEMGLGGWIDPEDLRLLLTVLGEVRERVPPELERRIVVALRELLLAVRALIDWCVERAERRAAPPADVQDIPIL